MALDDKTWKLKELLEIICLTHVVCYYIYFAQNIIYNLIINTFHFAHIYKF